MIYGATLGLQHLQWSVVVLTPQHLQVMAVDYVSGCLHFLVWCGQYLTLFKLIGVEWFLLLILITAYYGLLIKSINYNQFELAITLVITYNPAVYNLYKYSLMKPKPNLFDSQSINPTNINLIVLLANLDNSGPRIGIWLMKLTTRTELFR